MPEPDSDILGIPAEGEKPTTPAEDPNKQILETLSALKTSVESIGTRVDDFEARLNQKPVEETKDDGEEHFNPAGQTWDAVRQKWVEDASAVVEQKLEEQKTAQQEQQLAAEEEKKKIDGFIDSQITQLETANKLPKVVDANNENDPGRAARRELFGLAARIGTMDLAKTAEVIGLIHEAGKTYDPRANNGQGEYLRSGSMPGASAPVSSPSRSAGTPSGGPDYKYISAKSMDQIIREQMGS